MVSNIKKHHTILILIWILPFILLSCKTPSVLVTQEQQKGDYYNNLNQYKEAIVHYRNCLSASAKLGSLRNLDMEADICRKIAHGYSVMGQFDDALSYAGQAFMRDSVRNNQLEVIEDYRMMGLISLYKGDFMNGIPYLEHALDLNKGMESSLKGLNQQSVADTYLSLAQVSLVLGRFNEAIDDVEMAAQLYRKINDKRGIMESRLILGKINVDLGLYEEGKMILEESLVMAQELGLSTARHHQSLGEAYASSADPENALRHKLDALKAAEESGIIPQIVWSRIGVGDGYAGIGDAETAHSYYQSARDIQDTARMTAMALEASADMRLGDILKAGAYYSSIKSDVASGLVSLRMGEMNYEAGDTEDAISSYKEAIGYFTRSLITEGIAKAHLRLGDIYINQRVCETAVNHLQEAIRQNPGDETIWEIWYQKGRIFEMTGLPDSAILAYKKAVEIIEQIRGRFTIEEYKSKYIENKVRVYDHLIRLLLSEGDPGQAFLYSERARARAFLDMIGNRKVNIKQSTDKELIAREQDLRLRINSLSKMIHAADLGASRGLSRYQVEEELVRSRQEYSALLEQIKLTNREYSSMVSVEPSPLSELQGSLDDKTALLAYWISDEYLAIWVLTKKQIIPYMADARPADIAQAVADSRRAVRRITGFGGGARQQGASSPSDQLKQVYNQLISPVAGFITQFANIGIIPHGSLHFLPFQALIAPNGQYFIEQYNLFYTPSASVYGLCKQKEGQPGNKILAMAIGDLSLGYFSGLPGTKSEVEKISGLSNNITTRFETEATETFLKNNASGFRYLHFATHGIMDVNQPLYSYLLFAPTDQDDGLLTVHEVFGLNLGARLVTLSACETGLGDLSQGDELVGLSRAFLYAGSPAVIVSLWSVADQPTALLMATFYQNMESHPPQEALTIAQREVMKQYPSPFYWAPFQLIGRGD